MPAIEPPIPRGTPISRFDETAIERLETLLFEQCLPHGGLSLEAVDGLFSGALVSPGEPIALPELLPLVLGEASGQASPELLRLLELMWEATRHRIVRGPTDDPSLCMPLLGLPPLEEGDAGINAAGDGAAEAQADAPPGDDLDDDDAGLGDDFPVGASWAVGFMLAYDLRAPAWEARLDEDEDAAMDVVDILALIPTIPDDEDPRVDALLAQDDGIHARDIEDLGEDDEALEDDPPIGFQERLDIIA